MLSKQSNTIPFDYSDANKLKIKGVYKLDEESISYFNNQEKLIFEKGFRNELGDIIFNINNVIKASYTEYWDNGKMKISGQYDNGEKDGEWTHYNESGELTKTESWMRLDEGDSFIYAEI